MPVDGEVKRESKAGPDAADDKQQVGQQGSRFKRITTCGGAGCGVAEKAR